MGGYNQNEPTNYLRPRNDPFQPILGQAKGGGGAPTYRTVPAGAEPQSIQTQANASEQSRQAPIAQQPGNWNPPPQTGTWDSSQQRPQAQPQQYAPSSLRPGTPPATNVVNDQWSAHRPEMGAAFYRHAASSPGAVGSQYWVDRAGQAGENPLPTYPGTENSIYTDAYGNRRFDYGPQGAQFGYATGQYSPGDSTRTGLSTTPVGGVPNVVANHPYVSPVGPERPLPENLPGVTPGNQGSAFHPTEGRTLLQTGTPGVTPGNQQIRRGVASAATTAPINPPRRNGEVTNYLRPVR